jgi:uncharacterized phage-associated protein
MNIYRRKLLNTVLFFAKKTKYLNLTKLLKLLYFFDFTHFKQTGYPAIGLDYFAFDWGPVPKEFWAEIKDGVVPEDFGGKIALIVKQNEFDEKKGIEIKAIKDPELDIFTPREIEILRYLADVFKDARGKDISEVSHLPEQPWDITRKKSGKNSPIDYLLCIDEKSDISFDYAKESLKEYFAAVHNFRLKPVK